MATSIGDIVARLQLNIDNFATNMRRAEEQIKNTETKLSGFKDLGGRFEQAGTKLTMGLTAPIVGLGATSAKLFADFDAGMNKIGTVSEEAQVPLQELGDDILALSDKTGLSTTDMQEGLYDVISAGVSTKDSIGYLETAVKAAKGGFTDTATAVDGLTSTLNAYGLESENAMDIANQMMVAQNLGKTTFGEMASVMGNVAPTAKALGVSTEELFSSLAVLTANGIKTSEAVTGLKATYSNMIKPSKEAQEAAEALGLQFDANVVSQKGFKGALTDIAAHLRNAAPEYTKAVENHAKLAKQMEELEKGGKKNTDQYKKLSQEYKNSGADMKALEQANKGTLSGYATMFGSVEALNTVLTLTSDQGMALYDKSMEQMANSTGMVDKAFDKMNKGPGAEMQLSLNALRNAGIKMGDSFAPIMTKVAKVISDVASSFSKLNPEQQDMIVKVGLVIAAIGPGLIIFGSMFKAVSNIGSGVSTLKRGFDVLAGSTKLMTVAQGALNFVMGLNPITLIIIGVAGLIAGLVLLYNKCEGFRKFVDGMWAGIKSGFLSLVDVFKSWGPKILDFLKNPWGTAFDFIAGVAGKIKAKLEDVFQIKIPKIPLPHFDIKGKFSLNPPSMPSVDVSWYDKGGIFDKPSIIGVGEKRPEFVGALDDLKGIVGDVIDKKMGGNAGMAGATIGGLTIEGPVYVRNEQDIDKLSQAMYNANEKVLRALGKRDV